MKRRINEHNQIMFYCLLRSSSLKAVQKLVSIVCSEENGNNLFKGFLFKVS